MTDTRPENSDALERLFHEPKRLAILSALCTAREGLPFTELRDTCHLTDGNLNRHLKALEEEGIIRVRKSFVNDKPRTTVFLTQDGLKRFSRYLEQLAVVLQEARCAARGVAAPQSASPAACPA